MEVDELEFVSHFLLLGNLVGRLHDLRRQRRLLVLVLLNQRLLLPVLLLEELFNSFSLDVARPAVLPAHQNLTLEIIGVFSDLGDGHVGFLENGAERFQDGIGFDPALFDGFLESFGLLLGDLILLLRGEVEVDLLLLLLAPLLLLFLLLILGVLLLETHEVGLEEVVLPPHVLNVLEVALQLLRQLLDRQQLLALLRRLQLTLRHQLQICGADQSIQTEGRQYQHSQSVQETHALLLAALYGDFGFGCAFFLHALADGFDEFFGLADAFLHELSLHGGLLVAALVLTALALQLRLEQPVLPEEGSLPVLLHQLHQLLLHHQAVLCYFLYLAQSHHHLLDEIGLLQKTHLLAGFGERSALLWPVDLSYQDP